MGQKGLTSSAPAAATAAFVSLNAGRIASAAWHPDCPHLPTWSLTCAPTTLTKNEAVRVCGMSRVTRDPVYRLFVEHYLVTKLVHLCEIEEWPPKTGRSRALPGWRMAGSLTGALFAFGRSRAAYFRIEGAGRLRFMDRYYEEQIRRHEPSPELGLLRQPLLVYPRHGTPPNNEISAARGVTKLWAGLRFRCWLTGAASRRAMGIPRVLKARLT